MKEALLILDLENPPTMEKSVILDYLAYATFKVNPYFTIILKLSHFFWFFIRPNQDVI